MKKILWVGDGPDCPSGFGRATREIVASLDCRYGGPFDVTVLGINHRGDPPTVPYPVYAAAPGGDSHGIGRLIWMCDRINGPDAIVLQTDGWIIPQYMRVLRERKPNGEYAYPEYAHVPVIAIVAIDGKNFFGKWLDGITHAIFWTQFALDEAREGGYTGAASVIPLGVDLDTYSPMSADEKRAARLRRQLPESMLDVFIVGNVNRNQPRKRWDLTVKYFAEWITSKGVRDAWLYLHTAPTGDTGTDVVNIARYYGVVDRLALVTPAVHYGVTELEMRDTYNCFDVCISTTQGEGFGLPAIEAMACGVPCILPEWAAYGDWARSGAWLVPCTSTAIGPPYVNVIGGVADEKKFVAALHAMYVNKEARKNNAQAALETAQLAQYRWSNIGQRYVEFLTSLLTPPITEDVWRDLGRPEEEMKREKHVTIRMIAPKQEVAQ